VAIAAKNDLAYGSCVFIIKKPPLGSFISNFS